MQGSLAVRFIGVCLLLQVWLMAGQALAQTPCFTIEGADAVCAPGFIVVRNCVVGTNIYYIPDSTNQRNIINGRPGTDTIRYTTPGKYKLGQGILVGGVNLYTYKTVYILRPRKPEPTFILCDNYRVDVQIPKLEGERFVVDFGNGRRDTTRNDLNPIARVSYSYPTAPTGPVQINVRSLYNCGRDTTLTVKLLDPLVGPDSVIATKLGNNRVRIKVVSRSRYLIQVNQAIPAGQTTLQLQRENDTTVIAQTVDDGRNACLFVQCRDNCNKLITTIPFCLGEARVAALSERNRMIYSAGINASGPSPSATSVELGMVRDGQLLKTLPSTYADAVAGLGVNDSAVLCNRRYCYTARLDYRYTYAANRSAVVSVNIPAGCVRAISTRQPAVNQTPTISFENEVPVMRWRQSTDAVVKQYYVKRYDQTWQPPLSTDSTRETFYRDLRVAPRNVRVRYAIQVVDSCGNRSAIRFYHVPVRLAAQKNAVFNANLSWNRYEGWPKRPKGYLLQFLDDQRSRVIESRNLGDTIAHDLIGRFEGAQNYAIRIAAVPDTNIVDTAYSNIIDFVQPARVYMPNAFSPNDDKINDLYLVKATFLRNYQMRIVNRWGVVVFESTDENEGWDGKINGNRAPIDVYVATVTGKDEEGNDVIQTNMVTLIR